MATIDIRNFDKAAVLAALYNRASPMGAGFMAHEEGSMSVQEAQELIDNHHSSRLWFDYLKGRAMKVDITGDELRAGNYDSYYGAGAAEAVLKALESTGDVNAKSIQEGHQGSLCTAIDDAEEGMSLGTKTTEAGVSLGLNDLKDHLAPKIAEAKKGVRK